MERICSWPRPFRETKPATGEDRRRYPRAKLPSCQLDVPDEAPPFLGTWRRVYVAVIVLSGRRDRRILPVHRERFDEDGRLGCPGRSVGLDRRPTGCTAAAAAIRWTATCWPARPCPGMPWRSRSWPPRRAPSRSFPQPGSRIWTACASCSSISGCPSPWSIICSTVVPLFHHARVYTAYEYLENRFDAKTRSLASVIFLCQRGLSAGITIYAPALVLSAILGWPERLTTTLTGAVVVTYTSLGRHQGGYVVGRAADAA